MDWSENRDEYLPLVEFAYNKNWQASIGMVPFEALYGRKCRTPTCWNEVGEKLLEGPDLVQVSTSKVEVEAILAREEKVLRENRIPSVKVFWKNNDVREATWETEESIRAKYPYLFESGLCL